MAASPGGTAVSNGEDLDAWDTPSEVNPTDVFGFTVQLVAYDDSHETAWVFELPLDDQFAGAISGDELRAAIGDSADTVGAIVTYDDPTETVNQYAPYALTVNGELQPGG